MKNMMLDVIKQYSGYYAFIPGYEVGGKTGVLPIYYDIKLLGEIKPQVFFIYWIR